LVLFGAHRRPPISLGGTLAAAPRGGTTFEHLHTGCSRRS
jgi:hypothetical protein